MKKEDSNSQSQVKEYTLNDLISMKIEYNEYYNELFKN